MLTRLRLSNFKRFTDLELRLAPLTVLTGFNGAGKSTVLQSLLLIRQAGCDPSTNVVPLNGPLGLTLGEARDILNTESDQPLIRLGVEEQDLSCSFVFAVPEERSLHLKVSSRPEDIPGLLKGTGAAFTYLSADRLGPRDQLDVSADESDLIGVGVRGEYTAQALALHETDEVRPALRHTSSADHGVVTLRTQVESWAGDIIRPIRIDAQWPAGITASLIRFREPGLYGEPIRPTNTGFGISYALPVIVAGLLAPVGGLLAVENPEAHLHPAGQSRLGRFLARVAGSGVQVLVETHSDHVVNGIRLAVAEDRWIDARDVAIEFFGEGGPVSLDMKEDGSLSDWPRGFFDQLDEDLGSLSRARRRR
ncbi:MAG: hypothetical protein QG622_2687 [Actinomycetota bacterium]|nr:hypothetical protein [Actinomycetota bacterium]